MGIPESQAEQLFHQANIVVGAADRELLLRMLDLELSGEPRRRRSNFSNGIKRMPCTFTPGGATR